MARNASMLQPVTMIGYHFTLVNGAYFHKKCASAGNRTRAARVAGEHSTTEPPMLTLEPLLSLTLLLSITLH